jgi:hypothetical protein
MNYPYSYDNYKYGGSTYGLPSISGPYDFGGGGFSTTPFSVQPEKPKFDLTGTLYGAGALAEGIGNLVRGIRGDDVPPSRMAGQAFERYTKKDEPDYLMALLSKIVREREGQKNPIFGRLDLQPSSGKSIFGDIFA